MFGWGAWERRWIADDGLIVLRTVRNLLAGNGPVFNAGERVEANTSTIWTYLIYLGGWIGGPVRLEYVALALALVLSVAGVAMAMLGAGRLYAPGLGGRRALLLPAGALVYIAVPPARDFATSGLENCLVLAYLGLLWWMMVCWSQALRAYPVPQQQRPAAQGRAADPTQSTLRRCTRAAVRHQRRQPILRCGTGFRRRAERAGTPRAGAHRRAGADHDACRRPWLAAARADHRRGRLGAGRLRDLPDGLLRPAVPRHRAGQGCVGIQMGPRLCVSGQLQPTLSAVGSRDPACRSWPRRAGHPWAAVADPPRQPARAMAGLRAECKVLPP